MKIDTVAPDDVAMLDAGDPSAHHWRMTAIAPLAPADADGLGALREVTAGRYLIERELGRGGMGVVLLARDLRLERPVALKLLPPGLAAQPELRERFLREARAAAGLAHPNIVPIHAVEEHAGATFFVMGFVDGETLAERVRRAGPLPFGEVVRVLQDVGWALSYAHARGIVHRDVKPDNILVERASGRALVTDFGIARVADSTMTVAGTAMGTPQFMSPEQATGESIDGRSDLYSLGVVGFFALTATLPFQSPTVQGLLAMQVTQPAPPVGTRRAGVPPALAEAVDRCLAKDPADRFADADAFVTAIAAAQGNAAPVVAPQLRNYMRIAEASFQQAFSLFLLFPSLALLRPQAADALLAMMLVVPLITILQLAGRLRDLRRDGFTPGELDAAYEIDARQREEETALLVAARQRDGSIARGKRRSNLLALLGVLLIAAMVVQKRFCPGTLPATVRGFFAGAGGALFGASFALRAFSDPRRQQRLAGSLGPRTMRRVSRWLFGVASGRQLGGAVGRTPVATAGTSVEIGRLYAELPRATRRALGDVPMLAARLEGAADELGARIAQLERNQREVGRDAGMATLASASGVGSAAVTTLEARRAALGDELVQATQAAAAARAERLAAVEGLRMALLRLTSGLGTADDLRPELASARALLEASADKR